ncbi:MAG: hypothetical protein HY815_34135, partial [Candidatus Riflebacteria bacterium]|nr:hypothetical protein [Candidatus Riflebacteria bacterium]
MPGVTLYLELMALTLLLAVFSPSRRLFGGMFLGLALGALGEWATDGQLLRVAMRGLSLGLLLATFALGVLAISTRRLPMVVALPALALAISCVAIVRWDEHLSRFSWQTVGNTSNGLWEAGKELALVAAFVVAALLVAWAMLREAYRTDVGAGRALATALVVIGA